MTDAVLALEDLSTTIVRDLFRDGLAAAAAGADPLTDPAETERAAAGDAAPFVMSSFPDRNPFYPHVICEEAADSRDRIDRRANLMMGPYDVALEVYARSKTERNHIRDQVKKWLLDNVEVLGAAGFTEAQIVSSTTGDYDTTSKVFRWRIVVRGLVFTE